MSLTPEEMKALGMSTDDDWGFGDDTSSSTPAPTPKTIDLGGFKLTDESTTPDVKVSERAVLQVRPQETAAVLPPDAPKNDANAPAPEKAKRGRKPKAEITEADKQQIAKDTAEIQARLTATAVAEVAPINDCQRVELGPESTALLKAILDVLSRK